MDNFDIVELPVQAESGRLFGVHYAPRNASRANPAPTVICAHGLNRTGRDMDAWARELARRGYGAYCLDFRGVAESRSEGDPLELSLSSLKDDLVGVYRFLAAQPKVDANNIFLLGHSMGAAAAALAAAAVPNRIKGLVLLAPTFNVPDIVRAQYPEVSVIPDSATFFGRKMGRAFFEDARGLDFPAAQRVYHGPVLIIQGADDTTAQPGDAMQAAKTYAHAQLELISGVGHHFEGGAFKYAVKCVVGLLDEEADLADESGLDGDLNFGGGTGAMGGMGMMR